MNKKYIKYIGVSTLALSALSACSSGNCGTSQPPLALQLTAPTQYPAGVAVTAYLTIQNTSQVDAKNLVYTVPTATNHTGVPITIDPMGAGQDCTNITKGASCVFTALIPAGSHPGSFTVLATPTTSFVQQVKADAKAKGLQSENLNDVLQLTANIGLSNVPNVAGSFYIMPELNRSPQDKTTAVTVPMTVLAKSNVPTFDALSFVDEAGNITFASQLAQGQTLSESVLTYMVTIPAGKSLQDVRIQAKNAGNNVCSHGDNVLPECSNTAYVFRQGANTGYLTVEPRYTTESATYESQVITVTNQGDATVTGFAMPSTFNAPLSIDTTKPNTCANITSLAPKASCSFTVKYDSTSNTSGSQNFIFNYNDGKSAQKAENTISYVDSANTPYVQLIFYPPTTVLSSITESYPVKITNAGTQNVDEFEFNLSSGEAYPIYIYDEGNCEDDDQLSANGGTCTAYLGYFGGKNTAGSVNIPYSYEYEYDDEDYEFNESYSASYLPNASLQPTLLTYVSPRGNGGTYINTITLGFDGPVGVDVNTVNIDTVKLYNADDFSMGVTAQIISRDRYNNRGVKQTRVNMALQNQFTNTTYSIVLPDVSAIKDVNGRAIELSDDYSTANPLTTFTATGPDAGPAFGTESNLIVLNPDNKISQCTLMEHGGIINCSTPVSIGGLTGSTITAASFYGINTAYPYPVPYDANYMFAIGNSNGTFGNVNMINAPFTFTQETTGVAISNPTGVSTTQNNNYVLGNAIVYKCPLTSGSFTNCTQLSLSGVQPSAFGLYVMDKTDINSAGGNLAHSLMFITNKTSNSLTTCVDANDDDFATGATCSTITDLPNMFAPYDDTVIKFDKPYGVVAIHNANAGYADGLYHFYVTNNGFTGYGSDGAIVDCIIDPATGNIAPTDYPDVYPPTGGCYYVGNQLYDRPTSISIDYFPGLDHSYNVANSNGSMTSCNTYDFGYYCNRYAYTGVFDNSVSIAQVIQMN